MGELVTDGAARVAVIWRVIELGIVQRRKQHPGREINVVHLWIEIGVYGLRRHLPFGTIERFSDLGQLALGLELDRALRVTVIIAALDAHIAVITPMVRIANLVDDGVELGERLALGRGAHPYESLDVLAHRLLDLPSHVERSILGRRAEGARHELLT